MLTVSDEFAEQALENRIFATGTIDFADGTSVALGIDDFMEGGVTIDEATSSDGEFELGAAVIGQLSFTLANFDGEWEEYDFEGAVVTVNLVPCDENGDAVGTAVQKGIYNIEKPDSWGDVLEMTAYDNMSLFEVDYSEVDTDYTVTSAGVNSSTILYDICDHCGVAFTWPFTTTREIASRPDDDALTCLDMVSYIAQIHGCYARIDSTGALVLARYDMEPDSRLDLTDGMTSTSTRTCDVCITGIQVTAQDLEDYEEPTYYEYDDDGELAEVDEPVDGETYYTADAEEDDDGNVTYSNITAVVYDEDYAEGETYLYGEEGYVLSIEDNPLIAWGEADDIAAFVGYYVNGLTFRPFDCSGIGNPAWEPGDACTVCDYLGREYTSYITSASWSAGGSSSYSCSAETASENAAASYSASTKAAVATANAIASATKSISSKVTAKISKVQSGVDSAVSSLEELRETASELGTRVSTLETTVDGLMASWTLTYGDGTYTLEEIAKLAIDASSVTVSLYGTYYSDDDGWLIVDAATLQATQDTILAEVAAGYASIYDEDGNEVIYVTGTSEYQTAEQILSAAYGYVYDESGDAYFASSTYEITASGITSTVSVYDGLVTAYEASELASEAYSNAAYGTCSTDASTAAKVVDCEGFALADGACVRVYFSNANMVEGALTINVNETGDIAVKADGSAVSSSNQLLWTMYATITFQYDESQSTPYWRVADVAGAYSLSSSSNATTATKQALRSAAVIQRGTIANVTFSYDNTYSDGALYLELYYSSTSTGGVAAPIYIGQNVTSASNTFLWSGGESVQFVWTGMAWRVPDTSAASVVRQTTDGIEVCKRIGGSYSTTRTLMSESGFYVQTYDGDDMACFTATTSELNSGMYYIDAYTLSDFTSGGTAYSTTGVVCETDCDDSYNGFVYNYHAFDAFTSPVTLDDDYYISNSEDPTCATVICGGALCVGNSLFLREVRMPNVSTYEMSLEIPSGGSYAFDITFASTYESVPCVFPVIYTSRPDKIFIGVTGRTKTGCTVSVINDASSDFDGNARLLIVGHVAT